MATLSRVTAKLFGGNAPLGEIGQFGSAKAGSPLNTQDVATIQALPAYANGWGSAIMTSRNFPPIEEVTGVLKTLSYQNCYTLQEGVPVYDINTNYSATSIVKVVNGTNLSFYVSLVDDNIGNPLSDSTKWAKATFGERNLGEVITSLLPLSDAGLHLLDGSLLSGSGIYSAFVSYIANIYNSSLNYFTTEAAWQTSVSTYGVCGKFVYDSVNNTVRLPKVTGFVEGTIDVSALGDLVEAGLPNIKGTLTNFIGACLEYGGGTSTECFYGTGTAQMNQNQGASGKGIGFDASRSSSIYGNSNTVQPQAIKGFMYIVVATSTKTNIQVDIDDIATDLNGKADTDLTNAVPTSGFATAMNDADIRTVVETYSSGASWYRVWSDGWCEQGSVTTLSSTNVALMKNYTDTNYVVAISSANGYNQNVWVRDKSTSGFNLNAGGCDQNRADWYACGYIS